jgi:hypothetical protein
VRALPGRAHDVTDPDHVVTLCKETLDAGDQVSLLHCSYGCLSPAQVVEGQYWKFACSVPSDHYQGDNLSLRSLTLGFSDTGVGFLPAEKAV